MNPCRKVAAIPETTDSHPTNYEGDCLSVYEGKWVGDPEDEIDDALILQNSDGLFDPDLPYVVVAPTHIRSLISDLQNYLHDK